MDFNLLFDYARKENISDIHIIENENVYFRKYGEIYKNEKFGKIMREEILKISSGEEERDFIYKDEKMRRYRCNLYKSMDKLCLVMRIINENIIEIKDDFFNRLCTEKILNIKNGLILVTGVTGSGKTTTLANIIEKFNINKKYKILTLENPIEYVFKNKNSLIVQREIGNDVESFDLALKSSLRQDPDIIMVGEVRDEESLHSVLKLSETGHLVLTTLHTTNAEESINRMLSMVNKEKKDYVGNQISSVLRFIISQELHIDKQKKEIIPIFEILNNTKAISTLITNNKINQIRTLIESGKDNFMITRENHKKMLNLTEE